MKISFAWLDRKGKTHWPIAPRFQRLWSGKLWFFSLWKWQMCWDFRKGNLITWLWDSTKETRHKRIKDSLPKN